MQQLKIKVNEELTDNKAFRTFLEALPREFNNEGTVVHSGRNVLRVIDVKALGLEGTDRVMVKRYHGLFWFQKIMYSFFLRPKCRKAYDNTAELRRRGFDAARQLAVVEVWNHGLYQYAFFVSEVALGERFDALCLRLKEGNKMVEQHEVVRLFAARLACMHSKGILYNDMNGGNVMCRLDDEGSTWRFCLIDTNRVLLFEEGQALDLDSCIPDLILMNPRTGMVEDFIAEYLKARGLYTEAEACRIREIQRRRYERKRPLKRFLKRYKQQYYKWLER